MRYPAYPDYRPVDSPALQQLPTHWRLKRLRFATAGIEQGWSPQCDNDVAADDGWGVMKVGCVNGDRFDPLENKALPADLDPIRAYELEPGDVLVSRANTQELVGSAAVVPEGVRPRLLLCDKLFRIRTQADVQSRFLTYVLRTPAARYQYERDATGASGSMQNIGQDTIKNLHIPLPTDDEQNLITAFLDSRTAQIDALITKKQALLDRLTEKRTNVIASCVANGLAQPIATRASGAAWFAQVPKHWQVKRIKFIGIVGNGSTPARDDSSYWNEGSFPWLNSSVANQEAVTEAEQFVTSLALKECHLPIIEPPAVLVGITGQGKTRGMATTLMIQATINQHLAYIKPEATECDVRFLRRVFDAAYAYLRNESDGGGSTKGAITCEQIAELPIPVPPLEEQQVIVDHIDKVLDRINRIADKANNAIERLTEYRSALITAAVTGQIDVRDVKVPTPA
jgi:type I restriction enzyme S subunit